MSLTVKLFFLLTPVMLCGMILFVAFGQITVRKLRKNPKTKAFLGMELASGWDILNVAQALALPRTLSRRLNQGPFGWTQANSEVLYKYTSKFDRCLARIFYWLFIGSAFLMLTLALIDMVSS